VSVQVFDTAAVALRERADAVSDAMLAATLSTQLVHHDPHDVWLRIEEHQLGGVSITHVVTSGMDTTRTRRQTAADSTPVIALSLGMARGSVLERYGEQRRTTPGAVNLVELTEPYRSRIARGTNGWSVKIPLEQLAVPPSTIRNACAGLSASPVHPVFAHHLRSMARQAPRLEGDGAGALLGTATIALARALICSAADDSRRIDEAMSDSLLIRVQTYVRAHVTDPGLSPERIAAAHHVSLRQLYRACAAADLRLEQWIIELRLEGARQELAGAQSRSRTIAAVARHWCFINPSHFAHRFREAYGVTPREWQAGTEGTAPGSHGTSRVASG
jgi:AraC-like DNA-binding protein